MSKIISNLNKNLKQLNDFKKNIEKAKKSIIKVGLPKEKTSSIAYNNNDNVGVINVGFWNEYGTVNIPRRSFLRTSIIKNEKEINKNIQLRFKQIFEQKIELESALNLIGVKIRNYVVASFNNNGYGTWKSLSEFTIKAKGSSIALTNTGLLKQSITWIVEKG